MDEDAVREYQCDGSWLGYADENRTRAIQNRCHVGSSLCTGDMTLAPIVWDRNKGRFILDLEVEHTCRDYDALKKWLPARDSEHNSRWPENAARLHAEKH